LLIQHHRINFVNELLIMKVTRLVDTAP